MSVARLLAASRSRSGLSQAELARRAGTSQATLSAYESGRKDPGAATLARILAAAGLRLTVEAAERPVVVPSARELADRGRRLEEVVQLAEALPVRHEPDLRFPPLHLIGG